MTMIKVNLTPPEELADPYFWLPDAAFAVAFVLVGYLASMYMIGLARDEVTAANDRILQIDEKVKNLSADISRYDELEAEVKKFESDLNSLSKISSSASLKYRPIIVFEHLQNIRTDGLWFTTLNTRTTEAGDVVELAGLAFDNLIIAEFMSAIRSTKNQDFDPTDLRTHVYFDELLLSQVVASEGRAFKTEVVGPSPDETQEEVTIYQFTLSFLYKERKNDSPISVSFNFDIQEELVPMRVANVF